MFHIFQVTSSRDNRNNRIYANGGVLNINTVKKEDAGYYVVSATNDEGVSQYSFEIDVLYPPRYLLVCDVLALAKTASALYL